MKTQSVPAEQTTPSTNSRSDEQRAFVSTVLASTEDVWRERFSAMGRTYREPTLVLFTEATESACGMAGAAVGPFYCSRDEKVYIDLGFYDELRDRFGAPGGAPVVASARKAFEREDAVRNVVEALLVDGEDHHLRPTEYAGIVERADLEEHGSGQAR